MQLRRLGLGLLVALAVLFLAGGATAHVNDTDASDPPYGGDAADWAAWMEAHMTDHMGPGAAEWMDDHMYGSGMGPHGGGHMDGAGMGPYGDSMGPSGPRGGACH